MNTKAWIVTLASSCALACSSTPNTGFTDPGGSSSSSSSSGGDDSGGSSGVVGSSNGGGGSSGLQSSSSGGNTSSSSSSGAHSSSGSSSGGSSGAPKCSDGGLGPSSLGPGNLWPTQLPCDDVGPPVTLTAQPFTVKAGAEIYMCEVFPNPFNNVSTDILAMHGTMSKGSHHFFLFNVTSVEIALEPPMGTMGACAGKGIEFHPFPYLSQSPDWSVNYPQDSTGAPMGYPLVGQNYLMINVHYLNTGSTDLQANVNITLWPAKSGVVKTHVGTIFLNQTSMSVPVGVGSPPAPYESTKTWGGDPGTLPASYTIFSSWSHMHQWATKFTATTGGQTIYTETNWDSPNLFFHAPNMTEPVTATGTTHPITMTNNPSITWDCTYVNTSGMTLPFGDSAQLNSMCIYLGQYYPANPTAPDDIAVLN